MFGFGSGLEFDEGGDEGAAEVFDATEGVVGDGLALEVFDEPECTQDMAVVPKQRKFQLGQAFRTNVLFHIEPIPDPGVLETPVRTFLVHYLLIRSNPERARIHSSLPC